MTSSTPLVDDPLQEVPEDRAARQADHRLCLRVWVWGRMRLPSPASGMTTFIATLTCAQIMGVADTVTAGAAQAATPIGAGRIP